MILELTLCNREVASLSVNSVISSSPLGLGAKSGICRNERMQAHHDFYFFPDFMYTSLVRYCHSLENMLGCCGWRADRERD